MTVAGPTPPAAPRLAFLDGLRGAALVLMVVNHTARWWMDGRMTWSRYGLIYVTLTLAAPTFLFLVGFCLPLSHRAGTAPQPLGGLLRSYGPRGARIVLAGLLLNLVVFPEEPLVAGGVLQTIGVAIVAMAPALWLLGRWPAAWWVLLLAAGAGYTAFALSLPGLTRFVEAHPTAGLVLFYDFPPWPWLSLVLIGLALGTTWEQAHRRRPREGGRFLAWAAWAGAVMVAAFLLYDWWAATPVRFGLTRDIILNRHWTPGGPALLWVFGMLLLMLGAAYWVMEVRRWRLRPLVILGRTALALYFVHQIVVLTLVSQWLGWRFNEWPRFWLANAVLIVGLVGLGWAWMRIRRALAPAPPLALPTGRG